MAKPRWDAACNIQIELQSVSLGKDGRRAGPAIAAALEATMTVQELREIKDRTGLTSWELARRGGRRSAAKRRKAAANLKAAREAYWNKD